MVHVSHSSGPVTIMAAIQDPAVIAKILAHLGLPTRASSPTTGGICEFLQTAYYHPGFPFIS